MPVLFRRFLLLIFCILLLNCASAQPDKINSRNWEVGSANEGSNKVALIIGNSLYEHASDLREPANDAEVISKALLNQGYRVELGFNLDLKEMNTIIEEYAELLKNASEGVIYFAGHGFRVNGENYLAPIDANPTASFQVQAKCVDVKYLLRAIDRPDVPKLVLVDACRNNPFEKHWDSGSRSSSGVGMLDVRGLRNTIILFATPEKTIVADDNPFAESIAEHITKGGCLEGDIIPRVAATIEAQAPSQLIRPNGFLIRNICFGDASHKSSAANASELESDSDLQRYMRALKTNTLEGYRDYIESSPGGRYLDSVKAAIKNLGGRTAPTPTRRSASIPNETVAISTMTKVQPASFLMGRDLGEMAPSANHVHAVKLSPFYLSPTELTFREYELFCKAAGRAIPSDEGWGRGEKPIINVSWYDAVSYCNWLSLKQGLTPVYDINGDNVKSNLDNDGYRLPTEAEWEYVATRGNNDGAADFGNGKSIANPQELNFDASGRQLPMYCLPGRARKQTVEVKAMPPNEQGFYHLSGNVQEWCHDWYGELFYQFSEDADPHGPPSGTRKVVRGGSYASMGANIRSFVRASSSPNRRHRAIGFRLARTLR